MRIPYSRKDHAKETAAFSLIEMIGALAVVVILASIAVPVVVRQIDRAAWNAEATTMVSISNAVVMQAVKNKTISNTNTWANDAANWAGLPPSAITANARNYARAFLIDGSGWLGSTALPYTQATTGTAIPTSARLLIVSTISTALPASVATGVPSVAAFSNIWNAPDKTVPAGWTWTGKGEDLVIQRINLQPLFHRVIVYDRDTNVNCFLSIGTTNQVAVAPQYEAYYLHGSVMGLWTNSVQLLSEVVNQDMSRTYESGAFSDQIGAGPATTLGSTTNLDTIAYAFVNSMFPPVTKKGDNTLGVADSLLAYLNAYSSWANMSPCFSYGGNGAVNKVIEWQLMDAVANCFGGSAKGTCTIVP